MAGCRFSIVRFLLVPSPDEFDLGKAGRTSTGKAEVFGDALPDHPGNPAPGQEQRDSSSLPARHLGIDEEILKLLLSRHAQGPKAIPGTPGPEEERRVQERRA